MKRVILALLIISLMGTLVGIGTWALFSDYETSEENVFTSGSLDLQVDGEDDPNVATYFEVGCLKPGDEGLVEITLSNVGCIDGWASIHFQAVADDENVAREPELAEGDVPDDPDDIWDGELSEHLLLIVTADIDGDGQYERQVTGGWKDEVECVRWYIGPLDAESSISVMIEWQVPDWVGNIIQTDLCTFDIEFTLEQTPLLPVQEVNYEAEGDMVLLYSIGGGALEDPLPVPATCGFDIEYGPIQSGSTYRELTVAEDSWWWHAYCLPEPGAIPMLQWVTIYVRMDGDGSGELYLEGGDVDVHGETTEAGIALTWGDGLDDPAGSAWIQLLLEVNVFHSTTQPVPEDPSTWGALVMTVPLDSHFTTAVSSNHVTDTAEPAFSGVALNCNTITEGPGTPFAEAGGLAPYVGTRGQIVATGGVLDLIVLGFIELDVQSQISLALTPAPVIAPELVVTGIQQDDTIQICEELQVAIDVHNTGAVPGEGTIIAAVADAQQKVLAGPFHIPTGLIDPCETVTIPVDMGHVDEDWRGPITVWAGFYPLEDVFVCPMMALSPPIIEVVGIQQPAIVQPCEEVNISVDVHNAGDKPGQCQVTLSIEDEYGTALIGPLYGDTPVIEPCEAAKVTFGPIHIEEAWLGKTITVIAQACHGDAITCDIIVKEPPCLTVVNIQQPDWIAAGGDLNVAVDVHNTGGKPGECQVTLTIEDEYGTALIGPLYGDTPVIEPCDTAKVPFGPWHIPNEWEGKTLTVFAQSCCGEAITCDIIVTEPPRITVVNIRQLAMVQPGDDLSVAVDVYNAGATPGQCTVTVFVADALTGAPLTDFQTLSTGIVYPGATVTIGPFHPFHVDESWPENVVVVAESCWGDPFECPIAVREREYWEITYNAEGDMVLLYSIGGGALEDPLPVPASCGFDIQFSTATYTGSTYRELFIPKDGWWWYPYCSTEPIPVLNYLTIDVTMDSDGSGQLYLEGGDVDIHGETTEAGIGYIWGDGLDDPAGSAWMHLPLQLDVYSSLTPADPHDPATWGALVMTVPLDSHFTTAVSSNHVTDTAEPGTPGVALNCNTITEGPGMPFAESGGPAPYVGTSGQIVATGGMLDIIVLGVIELDVQSQMNLTLTPIP